MPSALSLISGCSTLCKTSGMSKVAVKAALIANSTPSAPLSTAKISCAKMARVHNIKLSAVRRVKARRIYGRG